MVSLLHPYFAADTAMVEVAPNGSSHLDLRPWATGRLEGTIRGMASATGKTGRVMASLHLERIDVPDPGGYKARDEWGTGVDAGGGFQAQWLLPGTYRLTLERQEFRMGTLIETGPGSGPGDVQPVGPKERTPLGEATVRAGETVVVDPKVAGPRSPPR